MAETINNNPAVIWGTRRISWSQLEVYCTTVIGQLKGLGIKPGDRVAICAPTIPEYIIVLFGLWRMKATACPVSPKLPEKTLSDYLSRINANLLLTTVQIKSTLHMVPIRTLHLNEVINFDARRDFNQNKEEWTPDMDQEATVIATSGSSGQSKAAVHTFGNHYYNALGSSELIPLQAGDRWLLSLPLYHVSGVAIVMRCFLSKAAMVIAMEDELHETITRRQITHISLVTTQTYRLLQSPEGITALKALKYILLGGSGIPQALIEQSKSEGLPVYVSYGLTEMASQVATGKAGECVKVLAHRELKIKDGEILVKGKTLFKGYIQAGKVQLPLTDNGWFKTGDLGQLNQGCLTVTGRMDNMFISGGENIQPEEIEKVLLLLKGVAQAIVIPKQDEEFGQRPVAFIKFDGQPIANEVLIKHCQEFLPQFKVPTNFFPWPNDVIDKGLKVSRRDFISRI
jgi:o-succinylbenzoate---CoA ligase